MKVHCFGPERHALQPFNKSTLEPVETPRPALGTTAAHVELDRDGTHALVNVWEMDDAVVYGAPTRRSGAFIATAAQTARGRACYLRLPGSHPPP